MTPPAPAVLIQIDENPNCAAWDGQVFQPRTPPKEVSQVRVERNGDAAWCEITGLDDGDKRCPAMACLVDDSGDGACLLVFGGSWGLRLNDVSKGDTWGVPYMLLPASGADLRFVS
ncbi:MAG TPA: hypothetical protein VK789_27975 [Bryobacteraceae bacterium]|jgi:hypothetical protein|nr:hypothetical protein [Bryobacteraceae bacterium]